MSDIALLFNAFRAGNWYLRYTALSGKYDRVESPDDEFNQITSTGLDAKATPAIDQPDVASCRPSSYPKMTHQPSANLASVVTYNFPADGMRRSFVKSVAQLTLS